MALFNADNRLNRIDNRIAHSKSFGVYGRGATVNGNARVDAIYGKGLWRININSTFLRSDRNVSCSLWGDQRTKWSLTLVIFLSNEISRAEGTNFLKWSAPRNKSDDDKDQKNRPSFSFLEIFLSRNHTISRFSSPWICTKVIRGIENFFLWDLLL